MKKISKLLSVIVCLALMLSFALVVSAEEITENPTAGFVASELGYENGTAVENIDGEVISFAFSDGGNSYGNCPKYYNTGSAIRFYGQNTLTISVADGYEILSVAIVTDSGNPMNADNTEFTNATIAFADDETSLAPVDGTEDIVLTYTKSSGHWKVVSVTVTYAAADGEEVIAPAGPINCQIPGNLEYTFASDDAASAGVIFSWTASGDGELGVARMGEGYMSVVTINGTYGELGDFGYIVKSGDNVNITIYAYGAGSVSVPVEFVAAGSQGSAALGTAENPEILTSLNAGVEKSLESGEYYYQYTARKAGELTINTIGDGTHNMEISIVGQDNRVYSNWDNDGEYVTVNVAEGDVVSIKVYFDFPGAGTISFNSEFDAGEVIIPGPGENPNPNPNPGTGDAIFAVLSILAVSGMGLTAVASKKH